jgi:hypothetical protein
MRYLWNLLKKKILWYANILYEEEFEDTKGVTRICKSKDRQHNGQKKKDKMTNNDLQNHTLFSEIKEANWRKTVHRWSLDGHIQSWHLCGLEINAWQKGNYWEMVDGFPSETP